MKDAETIKQVISQVAVEAEKATIVAVNEENRRHAMGTGCCNITETSSPSSGGHSSRQHSHNLIGMPRTNSWT